MTVDFDALKKKAWAETMMFPTEPPYAGAWNFGFDACAKAWKAEIERLGQSDLTQAQRPRCAGRFDEQAAHKAAREYADKTKVAGSGVNFFEGARWQSAQGGGEAMTRIDALSEDLASEIFSHNNDRTSRDKLAAYLKDYARNVVRRAIETNDALYGPGEQ